jgi:hypothetical protein
MAEGFVAGTAYATFKDDDLRLYTATYHGSASSDLNICPLVALSQINVYVPTRNRPEGNSVKRVCLIAFLLLAVVGLTSTAGLMYPVSKAEAQGSCSPKC